MAKKQTSDRVSSLAAQIMSWTRDGEMYWLGYSNNWHTITDEVRSLCASVLSQDETKGKRKKPRK